MRRKQVKLPMSKEAVVRIQKAMLARVPIPKGLIPRSLRGAMQSQRVGVPKDTQEGNVAGPLPKS
jgi:hypothetical protein